MIIDVCGLENDATYSQVRSDKTSASGLVRVRRGGVHGMPAGRAGRVGGDLF